MNDAALQLEGLYAGYGGSVVLRDTSIGVASGEAVALLGKNGMGKTTLLRSVMGHLPKQAGAVRIDGHNATHWLPHRVSRAGVAYAPQEKAIFSELSVRDNLRLGMLDERAFEERLGAVTPMFPLFKSRMKQSAGTLSGGEQKMLLVVRALMARPRVLLLDEITEGLQPSVIDCISEALLHERRQHGTAMLIVEQNVPFALKVADRYLVLKRGAIVDEGATRAPGAIEAIFDHLRI
jgi:ABC-type branched-subunit amino acid transport system ATPase component